MYVYYLCSDFWTVKLAAKIVFYAVIYNAYIIITEICAMVLRDGYHLTKLW